MANFEGTVPTKQGLVLIGKVGTGVPLNFTRVAVGSGVWSPEQVAKPAAMTGLIKEEMTLAISPESIKAKEEPEGDEPVGCYSMRVMLTNSGLASGFALREIGIYATDPDLGEILYAVDYAGDLYDYIPALPANAAPLEKIFNLDFLTGTAKEIFVNQSPVLLATVDDIGDHNTDPEAHPDLLERLATGIPEILTPTEGAEVGETPFFTFRPFVANIANTVEEAIQLQVDLIAGNFGAPIHDTGWLTTIAAGYELPAALLVAGQNIYKSRVRRRLTNGLISPWSDIPTMSSKLLFDYVDRAKNVSPSPGATNVMECPTFVGNAFSVSGDTADTHEATRGFILKDGVVLYETGDLGPVTQFTPPPGYHQVSGEYEWQIQYKGAILGWGEKSAPTRYHTASAFITGDEAISFSSWDGYDNASAAGVALADDAALRSNGVDQGELEGDWISYQVRKKIRDAGVELDNRTSTSKIVTYDYIPENPQLITDGGNGAGVVSNIQENPLASQHSVNYTLGESGSSGIPPKITSGSYSNIFDGNESTFVGIKSGNSTSYLYIDLVFAQPQPINEIKMLYGGPATVNCLLWGGSYYVASGMSSVLQGNWWVGTFDTVKTVDRLRLDFHMSTNGTGYSICEILMSCSRNEIDISDLALSEPPNRAHILPKLTAATGPAGTAFTAADFNEIPVANATLGTDTDTDRPDFILLESEKITPATPFRRVAIGASDLQKDSETRISETQCDTWKQGA